MRSSNFCRPSTIISLADGWPTPPKSRAASYACCVLSSALVIGLCTAALGALWSCGGSCGTGCHALLAFCPLLDPGNAICATLICIANPVCFVATPGCHVCCQSMRRKSGVPPTSVCVQGKVRGAGVHPCSFRSLSFADANSISRRLSFFPCGTAVRVVAVETGEQLHQLVGHTDVVTGVQLHPANAKQVVTCSLDGTRA